MPSLLICFLQLHSITHLKLFWTFWHTLAILLQLQTETCISVCMCMHQAGWKALYSVSADPAFMR